MKTGISLIVYAAIVCFVSSAQREYETLSKNVRDDEICGENLTYILDDDGVLTIRGSGDMYNFTGYSSMPWYSDISSIKSIIIEEGVTSIGDFSFSWADNLKNVTIAKSVTYLGESAFEACFALKSVSIPDGVKVISKNAFIGCTGLTDVIIPDSVTSIGAGAFENTGLTSVTIPDGVKSIEESTFKECTNLVTVTLPDSLETIGRTAFYSCKSLVNVSFPSGLLSIASSSFSGCDSLKAVFFQGSSLQCNNYAFGSSSIDTVCVSPDYNSSLLCGMDLTSESAPCQSYQNMSNKCYYPRYDDGIFIQSKRKNVKKWEDNTNDCMEYYCDNESGLLSERKCNDGYVVVEMEMDIDNGDLSDIDLLEVVSELEEVTGKDLKNAKVGVLVQKDGYPKLVLFLEDQEDAFAVAESLDNMNKGEQCKHGFLCRTGKARVSIPVSYGEISNGICVMSERIIIALLIILSTLVFY